MANLHFMGLDVGTTGCKTAIFDQDGHMLGCAYREYPILCDLPLQAEQDAQLVFSLLVQTMGEAVAAAQVDEVEALSLSVQGDALIPVDRDYRPLHNAVLGMDYRPHTACAQYRQQFDSWELYQKTGQPLHPINMLSKVLWLRQEQPAVFQCAERFITYAEFVMQRLGGQALIDSTMASRSMGYDLALRDWSEPLLATMGLTRQRLSAVCDTGTVLGQLRGDLAVHIGLKNTPVLVAGGHDQPMGAIGASAVLPGMAVDSTGTAEVLSVVYDQPRINQTMHDSFYACYFHAVPDLYFSFAHMQVGGILQRWYRDNLGAAEVRQAQQQGEDFYALAHAKCSPGPSPLLVLPHFNGSGTPLCDVDSLGAVVGLSLASTRHDILKGILDSLCYELKTNLDALETAGVAVGQLRAVGGGARSPLWLQTKADITRRPITTLCCKEAGCLGAAVVAAVGTGRYRNLVEATDVMVHEERVYYPGSQWMERYAQQYAVYQQLYRQLKPINQQLTALRKK